MEKTEISALIVEGGAMRSVFSAGILDGFLKKQFNPFDLYYGVSAGANNIAAYLAGEAGKSLQIYTQFALQKQFVSYLRFLGGGHFIDLDWLYNMTFSKGHIDMDAVFQHHKPFYIVVTNVNTGEAVYVKSNKNNLASAIKASASLPLLYRGFPKLSDTPVTDGGVSDGIPVQLAIEQGAKRIMILRSRQQSYSKKDSPFHKYIRWKLRRFPELVIVMKKRVQMHEKTMKIIRNPPTNVKIIEICTPDTFTLGRFCRNPTELQKGYSLGYELAEDVIELWENR